MKRPSLWQFYNLVLTNSLNPYHSHLQSVTSFLDDVKVTSHLEEYRSFRLWDCLKWSFLLFEFSFFVFFCVRPKSYLLPQWDRESPRGSPPMVKRVSSEQTNTKEGQVNNIFSPDMFWQKFLSFYYFFKIAPVVKVQNFLLCVNED